MLTRLISNRWDMAVEIRVRRYLDNFTFATSVLGNMTYTVAGQWCRLAETVELAVSSSIVTSDFGRAELWVRVAGAGQV